MVPVRKGEVWLSRLEVKEGTVSPLSPHPTPPQRTHTKKLLNLAGIRFPSREGEITGSLHSPPSLPSPTPSISNPDPSGRFFFFFFLSHTLSFSSVRLVTVTFLGGVREGEGRSFVSLSPSHALPPPPAIMFRGSRNKGPPVSAVGAAPAATSSRDFWTKHLHLGVWMLGDKYRHCYTEVSGQHSKSYYLFVRGYTYILCY